MEYKNLPLYTVSIKDLEDGIFRMSIVDTPAVDSNFLCFSDENKPLLHFNKEKQIVTGIALRADYPIYRRGDNGGFYVVFTAKDIEEIAQKFMKEKRLDIVNINHTGENVEDIYLIESYILNDENRPSYFKDIKNGSWAVSYKVENKEIWNRIIKGNLRGFSVEISAEVTPAKDIEMQKLSEYRKMINMIDLMERLEK